MTFYRPVLGIAFVILVLQIVSLEIIFQISDVSYGQTVARVKERAVQFKAVVQDSTYSAYRIPEHDSIVFVGDVMLGRNVEVLLNREGLDYVYRGLPLASLAQRPAIVGNFESSIALEHIQTPAFQMRFSVPGNFLPELKNAGFSHVSLANNHSLDYGASGYINATKLLEQADITTFGHGAVLSERSISYIKTPDKTIAIVGINASGNIPTQSDMRMLLSLAGEQSDLQIVYIHWGTEYDTVHSKTQSLLAKELVTAGADLIVGHHPHVTQDIDVIDGVVVFYSLGNYIFDQYFSDDVKEGLVLSLELHDEPVISLIPVESKKNLSQPTLMAPENHAEFLRALSARSNASLKESIERGLIPLSGTVATSTKMAIMVR